MKIGGLNDIELPKENKVQKVQGPQKDCSFQYSVDYLNSPNPSEALGRSQVKFNSSRLSNEDKNFVYAVAESLNLSKDDTKQFEKIVTECLKEKEFESLNDLNGEDHIEDVAVIIEKVTNALELVAFEENFLASELTKKAVFQNSYHPVVDKNIKHFDVIDSVCKDFGIGNNNAYELYHAMSDIADVWAFDSIFDCLDKGKNPWLKGCINDISEAVGLKGDALNDFILELYIKSKNAPEKRVKKGIENTSNAIFYRRFGESVIAKSIVEKYGLANNNMKYIEKVLSQRKSAGDENENWKAAFLISGKFGLDYESGEIIVKLIDDINSKDYSYFDAMLINELTGDLGK